MAVSNGLGSLPCFLLGVFFLGERMVLQTFQNAQVNFEGHQTHMACSAQVLILLRKTGCSANTGRG